MLEILGSPAEISNLYQMRQCHDYTSRKAWGSRKPCRISAAQGHPFSVILPSVSVVISRSFR